MEQNTELAKSGRKLCANLSNAFDYNIVLIKRGLSLNRDVISAQASFKTARIEDDCHFPEKPFVIDWRYIGPVIVVGALSLFNLLLICFCVRHGNVHFNNVQNANANANANTNAIQNNNQNGNQIDNAGVL